MSNNGNNTECDPFSFITQAKKINTGLGLGLGLGYHSITLEPATTGPTIYATVKGSGKRCFVARLGTVIT